MKHIVGSLLLLILFSFDLGALDTKLQVQLEGSLKQNQPIEGTILITHEKDVLVDMESFTLEGKPLSIDLIGEAPTKEGNLWISTYRFQISGQLQGLHVLPSIQVVIGGKTYQTIPMTYEVQSAENLGSLFLETLVNIPSPFYPKQHGKFIYKIYYQNEIELSKEELPLLEATGFAKIGQKEIKDYQIGNQSVQEILQEVQALEPGTYVFPLSVIEGTVVQDKSSLLSSTPALKIIVEAFPAKDRPPSFNGALGQFQVKSKLITPSELYVGDKISLEFEVVGTGEFSSISIPNLPCQLGFSGFFQMSDFPPSVFLNEYSKKYIIEMRPLTENIQNIPSIEFAYFDPLTSRYHIVHTEAIALTVESLQSPLFIPKPYVGQLIPEKSFQSWKALFEPSPISIEGNEEVSFDLKRENVNKFWLFYLIAIGWAMLYLQKKAIRFFKEHDEMKSQGIRYWEGVQNNRSHPPAFFHFLEKAFLVSLWEKKYIQFRTDSFEDLGLEGLEGEVRRFLYDVAKMRFSGQDRGSPSEIFPAAEELFKKI